MPRSSMHVKDKTSSRLKFSVTSNLNSITDDDFEVVSIDGSTSPAPKPPIPKGSKTMFLCNICKICFSLRIKLEQHMKRVHQRTTTLKHEPNKSKTDLQQIRKPTANYHTEKFKYVCCCCSYVTSQKAAFELHIVRSHGPKMLSVGVSRRKVTETVRKTKDHLNHNKALDKKNYVHNSRTEDYSAKDVLKHEVSEISENNVNVEMSLKTESADDTVKTNKCTVNENEQWWDVWSDASQENKLYTCPYCQFDAEDRTIIHAHITKNHFDRWTDLACLKDGRKKPQQVVGKPKRPNHRCPACPYATTKKSILDSHIQNEHPDLTPPPKQPRKRSQQTEYQCDQCDFLTRDRRSIQIHIERRHVTEPRYPCEFCGKRFKVKCDLTSHVRFQHLKTPAVCDVCGKICSNTNSLHVHQKREHYKPEFECNICKRRMVTEENLKEHIQRQHEQRIKYICEQCGKSFNQQNKLRQHIMTHTGERPHICHICGKAFARRAVFRQHLLIHTGQRPYLCDICGKSFTQKPGLICHRKSHPGEKPPLPVVYINSILDKLQN